MALDATDRRLCFLGVALLLGAVFFFAIWLTGCERTDVQSPALVNHPHAAISPEVTTR